MEISRFKIWFVLCLGIYLSCKKHVSVFENTSNNSVSFLTIFDEFWTKMNINYVYWSIDTTDWDRVYKIYRPIFAQLNIHESDDVQKSVNFFREITSSLVDGHYQIDFLNDVLKDSIIFPSYSRKLTAANFHNPFPYFSVDSSYFDRDFNFGYDYSVSPSGVPLFLISATIDNEILYFHSSSFYILSSIRSGSGKDISKVWSHFVASLNNPDLKKVILDLRGNQGGALNDLNFFVGQFAANPLLFGFTRYKKGNGRLDYTPWINAVTKPFDGVAFNKPLIILADNFSASLAETIILALKRLDQVTLIGEKTWGATGPLTSHEIYESGSFKVRDFMSVKTSSAMFRAADQIIYEGEGIEPDIFIPFDRTSLHNGIDSQLEGAIDF